MASSNFLPHSFSFFCRGKFATKLVLPNGFLEEHNMNLDRASLELKKDPGRRTWDVKIRKIHGVSYFVDGWWSDFVVDNGVVVSNILLFEVAGVSAFRVSIYSDASAFEIPSPPHASSSPPPIVSTDDEDKRDRGEHTWRFVKKVKGYYFTDQRMDMPKKFATGSGIAKRGEVELENEEGSRWKVGITDRKRSMFNFSRGLREFLIDNNVEKNAILLFEYVRYGVLKVVEVDKRQGEKLLRQAEQGGFLRF